MPVESKVFTYELDGLAYTVTVYEENGSIFADITVDEGAMDVNAVYFGDDDFSGDSASLSGPLNMNGVRLEGEGVQWDEAAQLSDPGLGREGEDKETYLTEGDTLTIELNADSLDDIDVFGIRATSTTTDSGSIKAVSDDPEEPEEPEEPFIHKVGFGYALNEDGVITDGYYFGAEDLPEGTDPTFANYLSHFENEVGGDVQSLEAVAFFEFHEDGYPVELFRIEAPEDGFADSDEIIGAYDEAVENGAFGDAEADDDPLALLATLDPEELEPEDTGEEDLDLEDVLA